VADGIYIGMAAAAARAEQLDSIADNLANAETLGYKSARPAFQSFLPGPGPTDKVFMAAVATSFDMSPGESIATDDPMDVLPEDNAFLAVMTSSGPAFTRNGKLSVATDGTLTAAGRPVLGVDGNPIVVPGDAVGQVSIKENGSVEAGGEEIGVIALYQLQGNLTRLGASLFTVAPGGQATLIPEGDTVLRVGALEMGNAPPLEAAISMITAQRQYETAMQAIQTYRRLDDRALEVGRVR
jgi:flagellar basal-body rod protein FlgF